MVVHATIFRPKFSYVSKCVEKKSISVATTATSIVPIRRELRISSEQNQQNPYIVINVKISIC